MPTVENVEIVIAEADAIALKSLKKRELIAIIQGQRMEMEWMQEERDDRTQHSTVDNQNWAESCARKEAQIIELKANQEVLIKALAILA